MLRHTINGPKKLVVDDQWYRATQFLTVSFITGGTLTLYFLREVSLVNHIVAIVTSCLIMWSILYFIRLLPNIGKYMCTLL